MGTLKLYTPLQVAAGSFIGGPGAVVYMLVKNFQALGDRLKRRQTCIFGGVFIAAIFCLLPFLPDRFPRIILPLAYTAVAWLIATKLQLSKPAILASGRYECRSAGNVVLVSLGFSGRLRGCLYRLVLRPEPDGNCDDYGLKLYF